MACFIVPAAEAIAVTAATKLLGHKKQKKQQRSDSFRNGKLGWLNKMLWGGSALLAFEHLWHGEVVPFFPFLSAMESAEETASMLHEMGTVGAGMALMVTGVWIGMVAVSRVLEKRRSAKQNPPEARPDHDPAHHRFAAVAATALWYGSDSRHQMKWGTLCWLFGVLPSCGWWMPSLNIGNWARAISHPTWNPL